MIKKKIVGLVHLLAVAALLAITVEGSAIAGEKKHFSYVPELDPHTAGAALACFGGAAAILIERYRLRKRRPNVV